MTTLEKIQSSVIKLNSEGQEQVLSFIEFVTESTPTSQVSGYELDEAELEWASYENHAAEASA
jgi:hypothetical protein